MTTETKSPRSGATDALAKPRSRSIAFSRKAFSQQEGRGALVHRTIGTQGLSHVDPFLLLDEFELTPGTGAGFPDHPHRGFETVTYMLSGQIEHRDTAGNSGIIGPGDIQWMTAGSGLVHSEMPKGNKHVHGMQLWVNLPASHKMIKPRCQDIAAKDIPVAADTGYKAVVIAGSLSGDKATVTGPVKDIIAQPIYLDVTMTGPTMTLPTPVGHRVFVYILAGSVEIDSKPVTRRELVVLTDGDSLTIKDTTPEGQQEGQQEGQHARFIVVGAKPNDEQISRYGPFVMNSRQEIMETIDEWNRGEFPGHPAQIAKTKQS